MEKAASDSDVVAASVRVGNCLGVPLASSSGFSVTSTVISRGSCLGSSWSSDEQAARKAAVRKVKKKIFFILNSLFKCYLVYAAGERERVFAGRGSEFCF